MVQLQIMNFDKIYIFTNFRISLTEIVHKCCWYFCPCLFRSKIENVVYHMLRDRTDQIVQRQYCTICEVMFLRVQSWKCTLIRCRMRYAHHICTELNPSTAVYRFVYKVRKNWFSKVAEIEWNNFSKSQSFFREGKLGIFPTSKASLERESSEFFQVPEPI